MRIARSILKLTRLDSSLLIALAVFIPVLARTRDLDLSLRRAVPLLFIGMCTFIANDLDDVEKDRINHADRPLPSGRISLPLAAALYFICLAAALFTARLYVQAKVAFWYYLLLLIAISYGYVVECFPGLKSPYVAGATSIPVLIVAASYPAEGSLYRVAWAVFFMILGRELCMDFMDRTGDEVSFMHKIGPRPLATIAFSSQSVGLLLLADLADGLLDIASLILMTLLTALSVHYWFKGAKYTAITLIKIQLFVGLCFLV